MYKVRRTTEFGEEARLDVPGSSKKRQTRSTIRSLAEPTPISCKTAPNRKTVSLRAGVNLERDRASQMGTPMRRQASSSVERNQPLPSDKKWVAERSQLLSEYLSKYAHAIPNVPQELFQRGGSGLRQMTMKQFVAIVNFFFLQMWPNRNAAHATNHVEDIQNALQKLNYPYQVNKSSLMTPTTQHSFGHIIVMLDFLKDLAPQPKSDDQEEELPFVDTLEQASMAGNSVLSTTTQNAVINLDEELNSLLFTQGAACFHLWDQERTQEEAQLQSQTRDIIISKKCEQQVKDENSMDLNLKHLQMESKELDLQLKQALDQQKLKQLEQLEQDLIHVQTEYKTLQQDILELKKDSEMAETKLKQNVDYIQQQDLLAQRLQRLVSQQTFTSAQLKSLTIHLTDLKNKKEIFEREAKRLTEADLNQQVMLTRAKKKLLDQLEIFNSHARLIAQLKDQTQDFTLSVPPQLTSIQKRQRHLQQLAGQLQHLMLQHQQNQQQMDQQKHQLIMTHSKMDSHLAQLSAQLRAQQQQLQQEDHKYQQQKHLWDQQQQQLIEQLQELKAQQAHLKQELTTAEALLLSLHEQNDGILTLAEGYQEKTLQARNQYLNEYSNHLSQAKEALNALNLTIERNNLKLEQAKQQMENSELPSLQPIIDLIKKI